MTEPTYLLTEAQREQINKLLEFYSQKKVKEILQSLPMVQGEPVAKQTKGETDVELDFHSDNTSNGQQRGLVGKMEVGQSMGDRAHKSESNTDPERAVALIRDIDEHGPMFDWLSHWANYPIGTKLYTSPQAPKVVSGEPVNNTFLTTPELSALNRFCETCEDGEGYDVPKSMMHRLAQIGVLRHLSRGIYTITEFGQSVVEPSPQALKPITDKDVTDEMVKLVHKNRLHSEAEIIAAIYNAVIKNRSEA